MNVLIQIVFRFHSRLVGAGVPMDPDERKALLKSSECSLSGRYVGEAYHHSHHT
jgi:hypothetical protein